MSFLSRLFNKKPVPPVPPLPEPKQPSIFLGMPSRGVQVVGQIAAILSMGNIKVYQVRTVSTSLLTATFNALWVGALNEREHISEFAMLHDDVVPLDVGWMRILYDEYKRSDCDILSCVVPIKDERGISSTAVCHKETMRMQRLTIKETCDLKEKGLTSFDAEQAGFKDHVILPNTGLWICDFTKPWVEDICFTISDKIYKNPTGKWVTQCYGEDWGLGIQAMKLGLKVKATTCLQIYHHGGFNFPNYRPFGIWDTDAETNWWDPPVYMNVPKNSIRINGKEIEIKENSRVTHKQLCDMVGFDSNSKVEYLSPESNIPEILAPEQSILALNDTVFKVTKE